MLNHRHCTFTVSKAGNASPPLSNIDDGHARGQGGSRPDHVVISEKMFRAAEQVDVEEVRHISDH
eukprot:1160393-Pelagomonas_calceolata.AAC.6